MTNKLAVNLHTAYWLIQNYRHLASGGNKCHAKQLDFLTGNTLIEYAGVIIQKYTVDIWIEKYCNHRFSQHWTENTV